MACLTNKISAGYEACGGNQPGVKKFWLANFEDVTSVDFVEASNSVTGVTMSGSTKFYAFIPTPRTTLYEDAITKNVENGVSYYNPKLTIKLAGLSASSLPIFNKIIKANGLVAIIEGTDGTRQILGMENGLFAETGGKVGRGAGGEDFVGAEIVLSSYDGEANLAPILTVDPSTLV